MKRVAILGACIASTCGGVAFAHHSYAMFDAEKTLILEGTLKEVAWTNPHAWLVLSVPQADGSTKEWGLETLSPVVLVRQGWRTADFKAGDHVTVTAHPRKDGTAVASLTVIQLPDGRRLVTRGSQKAESGE